MSDPSVDELEEELREFREPPRKGGRSVREERIIAGFEEIQRFVDGHGHIPRHGEGRDIFERLYAVRLDRLRALEDCRALLAPLDRQNLLTEDGGVSEPEAPLGDDELMEELAGADGPGNVTDMRHVRSNAEKRAADEIANRTPCADFASFKEVFERAARDLKSGLLQAQPIGAGNRGIEPGDLFVLGGLIAYVAEVGAAFKKTAGEPDSRLRVIYANGTESNLLLRSLQRAFYEDAAARRLVAPASGQMGFGDTWESDDVASGTIYVLRSLSDDPYIAQHRELIHKIGVTGGNVEARLANAEHEATYLLARAEVVATYRLAGINRTRLEKLFHKLFAAARLNVTIEDRFGNPVQPQEWFLVPLPVIDEAVERLRDGTITEYVYDPKRARLVKASGG